jgi:hypothetical protein
MDEQGIKAARDAAIAAGKTPILIDDMRAAEAMVAVARDFLESCSRAPAEDLARSVAQVFQDGAGESELTMVWEEDGLLCRARPDRITLDRSLIVDYKTCNRTAEPNAWGRTYLSNMGYYKGGAFYRRGVKALAGVLPEYIFFAQEQEAPFLCSLIGMDPATQALGARFVQRSTDAWRVCMKTNNWPGYPNRVVYPELPPWEFARDADHEFGGMRTTPSSSSAISSATRSRSATSPTRSSQRRSLHVFQFSSRCAGERRADHRPRGRDRQRQDVHGDAPGRGHVRRAPVLRDRHRSWPREALRRSVQVRSRRSRAPFSPARYSEAIAAADKAGYPVIVVDSFSHEWAGDGGVLDMQEAELDRMAGSISASASA